MATPSSPRIAGIEGTFTPATAQAFIEYVQSHLGQFETRMSEHDTLFQQLTQLKTENAELKKQNDDLRREMSELRSQLTHQGGHLQTSVDPTSTTVSSDEVLPVGNTQTAAATPKTLNNQPTFASLAAKPPVFSPANPGKRPSAPLPGRAASKKQRIAAARALRNTLNLEEDYNQIREIVDNYLEKHAISEWKYEAALKILIGEQLVIEPTNNNLKKLGEIYLKGCLNKYKDRSGNCSTEEKEKIESIKQSIQKICTSTPVRKLLNMATYIRQFSDEAVISRIQQGQQEQQDHQGQQDRQDEQASQAPFDDHFRDMTPADRLISLCDKFGIDGHLDLMEDKIAKRYKKYLKKAIDELESRLQPMATKKESEMLMKISKCKSRIDIDNLLASFYAQQNMDPICRYIRLAFATAAELWSSRILLKTDHNESWFRSHVYSAVFDNAFLYDDKFTSKRADCYSNITKEFKDVDNQRVDFILRNVNDDNDYLSAEEKPGLKGVKSDLKKGKALQKAMLRKWRGNIGSMQIMKHLEAITCQ
ncbi:hypothetical protein BDF20DRAFT_860530 [Mycotypha africana]|uniref:uncharacterized protein n=1 Tax=Mycotypha africana TaxID=64632 RepID=UPI0023009FDF|nr:uncharacterized protein BDF20DRAFT_860530 [Mycotypha africana]KAI8984555.1 hypothetical protein BDF20DRAFT_860530 [Mycotypha africana]